MNKQPLSLLTASMVLLLACNSSMKENKLPAPSAEKQPFEIITHGHKRTDNYFWMRLTEEQKNAEHKDAQTQKVLDYLNAENAYLKATLEPTEGLQKKLYNEMIGRIKQTDESVPYKENGYWYYTRYEQGKEYPVYGRKKEKLESPEEILLDVNKMAEGHSYYDVKSMAVSENNNLLVYSEDTVSRRRYTLYVKDLSTHQLIGTPVTNTEGEAVWANDHKTFFYVRKDSTTLRSRWIMRHTLGTNPENDVIVYEEKDESYYIGISKTKSKKYLIIASNSTTNDVYHILDASQPNGTFRAFSPREKDHKYSIDHYQDQFYIVTNFQALNFRLMATPEIKTEKINWKEVIPHRKDTLLVGIEIFKNHLVVSERAQANTLLRIIDQRTHAHHYLNFGEPAYTVSPSINMDFDTDLIRYRYSSLTTPSSTYDYNMNTKQQVLLKQQEVVGGHNPADYVTERIWATAADGTKIPMSIVYKKGLQKNGQAPCLLYGYGSYGISTNPSFSLTILSLLNRGFVYAIAHSRGGEEMGRQWYEDGKMFKKKNTFTDFIACTEHLLSEKYSSADKLFASGGSAGGLLMGAIVNMRPDLYKGVIAAVPFVDVVSTMLDETIPLTTNEFDEWGNPDSLDSYHYMLEYSPYDQVKAQAYPNLLVTTGLHDSQVQYWEPAKWVAKLRAMKTDKNLLLLRTNMETGHGGTTGRFKVYEEKAQDYAFILHLLNINE
jgi:oligopeptidase B